MSEYYKFYTYIQIKHNLFETRFYVVLFIRYTERE